MEAKKRERARAHARKNVAQDVAVCRDCGCEGELERHHPDYDRPLDIEWLCHPCHSRRHYPVKMRARTLVFDHQMWEALRVAAFEKRASMSELVRDAIEAYKPLRPYLERAAPTPPEAA